MAIRTDVNGVLCSLRPRLLQVPPLATFSPVVESSTQSSRLRSWGVWIVTTLTSLGRRSTTRASAGTAAAISNQT